MSESEEIPIEQAARERLANMGMDEEKRTSQEGIGDEGNTDQAAGFVGSPQDAGEAYSPPDSEDLVAGAEESPEGAAGEHDNLMHTGDSTDETHADEHAEQSGGKPKKKKPGFLKRATYLFMGKDKKKDEDKPADEITEEPGEAEKLDDLKEELQHETDSAQPEEYVETPEQEVTGEMPTEQEPSAAMAGDSSPGEPLTGEAQHDDSFEAPIGSSQPAQEEEEKKVSFTEPEVQPAEGDLHGQEESGESSGIPAAAIAGGTAGAATGAALASASREGESDHVQPSTQVEDDGMEASSAAQGSEAEPQKKKKNIFSSLFSKKDKDKATGETQPTEPTPEVNAGEASENKLEEMAPAAEPLGGTEEPSVPQETPSVEPETQQAEQEESKEKKGNIISRLFGFNDKEDSTAAQGPAVGTAAAGDEEHGDIAPVATGAAAVGGIGLAAAAAGSGSGGDQGASQSAQEAADKAGREQAAMGAAAAGPDTGATQGGPKSPTKECKTCKGRPKPAEDAEVTKAGSVQKRSRLLKRWRLREVRLLSDGTFQYSKTENFDNAKGCKLTSDMKVEEISGKGAYKHAMQVSCSNCRPIVLGFENVEDRNAWMIIFNGFKQRLSAATPDNGQAQVLKSSNMDGATEEAAGTGQVSEPNTTGQPAAQA